MFTRVWTLRQPCLARRASGIVADFARVLLPVLNPLLQSGPDIDLRELARTFTNQLQSPQYPSLEAAQRDITRQFYDKYTGTRPRDFAGGVDKEFSRLFVPYRSLRDVPAVTDNVLRKFGLADDSRVLGERARVHRHRLANSPAYAQMYTRFRLNLQQCLVDRRKNRIDVVHLEALFDLYKRLPTPMRALYVGVQDLEHLVVAVRDAVHSSVNASLLSNFLELMADLRECNMPLTSKEHMAIVFAVLLSLSKNRSDLDLASVKRILDDVAPMHTNLLVYNQVLRLLFWDLMSALETAKWLDETDLRVTCAAVDSTVATMLQRQVVPSFHTVEALMHVNSVVGRHYTIRHLDFSRWSDPQLFARLAEFHMRHFMISSRFTAAMVTGLRKHGYPQQAIAIVEACTATLKTLMAQAPKGRAVWGALQASKFPSPSGQFSRARYVDQNMTVMREALEPDPAQRLPSVYPIGLSCAVAGPIMAHFARTIENRKHANIAYRLILRLFDQLQEMNMPVTLYNIWTVYQGFVFNNHARPGDLVDSLSGPAVPSQSWTLDDLQKFTLRVEALRKRSPELQFPYAMCLEMFDAYLLVYFRRHPNRQSTINLLLDEQRRFGWNVSRLVGYGSNYNAFRELVVLVGDLGKFRTEIVLNTLISLHREIG